MRAGFDAELVQERAPSLPVGVERLLLPPGAVQGEDVLLPETFAIRMLGDQALELGQERVMATQCELGVVAELDGPEAQVLEPARLASAIGSPARSASAGPCQSVEGAPQILGGIGRAVPLERAASTLDEAFELLEIELSRLGAHAVADPVGLDPLGSERLP